MNLDKPIFVKRIEDSPGLKKSLSSNAATIHVTSFFVKPKFDRHFSATFLHRSEIGSPSGSDLICSPDYSGRHVKRFSHGFLSQDVMKLLKDSGKSYNDFSGLLDELQEDNTLNSKGKRMKIGTREQAAKEPEKYWGANLEDY